MVYQRQEDYHLVSKYYNIMPLLDEQQKNISPSTLEVFAQIFLRHGTHTRSRLSLLHRHCKIPSDTVMMHSRGPNEEDICMPQMLDGRTLQPCVYLYRREYAEFWPVEFEEAQDCQGYDPPSDAFLSELGSTLVELGLDSVLGLSWASPTSGPWIESLRTDGPGTIARRLSKDLGVGSSIVTAWAFLKLNGEPVVTPAMECEQTRSGVHDPPPWTPPNK